MTEDYLKSDSIPLIHLILSLQHKLKETINANYKSLRQVNRFESNCIFILLPGRFLLPLLPLLSGSSHVFSAKLAADIATTVDDVSKEVRTVQDAQ